MFDKYIIDLKQVWKMGKKVQNNMDSSSEWDSPDQKESIYEECEEHSTIPAAELPDHFKKEELDQAQESQEQDKKSPIKPISKRKGKKSSDQKSLSRKKRIHNPLSKFLKEHRQRFFLFPFLYATSYPFCKISWEYWKPSGYFIHMAKFLSSIGHGLPTKTSQQCKSFDQRQKKEIYTDLDLLEAGFTEFEENGIDAYSVDILEKYVERMEEESEYMQFLAAHDPSAADRNQEEEQYRCQASGDSIFNEFFDMTTSRARVF